MHIPQPVDGLSLMFQERRPTESTNAAINIVVIEKVTTPWQYLPTSLLFNYNEAFHYGQCAALYGSTITASNVI